MKDPHREINNFYTSDSVTRLINASISEQGLIAEFSNLRGKQLYPWLWVRDHCIDAQSLNQQTTQRLVDTFSLAADITCIRLNLELPEQMLHLSWSNTTRTSISAYVLASVIGFTPELHTLAPSTPRVLWNKDSPLSERPTVAFDDVIESDSGVLQWLQNIHIYGFSLVQGVPATQKGTKQLALRLGAIQETIFGDMWPLSAELTDHGDTAYGSGYLEPHTDGTYYHDAPGLQMFNCLEIDCQGGQSIQLDGFAIAEKIKRQDPAAYKTLTEVVVAGHYLDEGVHLRAERPPISLDASGQVSQISFNNYDRAPMLLSNETQQRFYHAYGLFHSHVVDQDNWLKIDMKPGSTLIFDNWRNLHGRMGFSGRRYFYGCYHSKSVFESKLRIMQSSI
ncbi:MAG: trimethyllysine dioxygenase [Arenicella sp.]|jgi:trimethyllysine dioxygenase